MTGRRLIAVTVASWAIATGVCVYISQKADDSEMMWIFLGASIFVLPIIWLTAWVLKPRLQAADNRRRGFAVVTKLQQYEPDDGSM